jgi:hypothetical protein
VEGGILARNGLPCDCKRTSRAVSMTFCGWCEACGMEMAKWQVWGCVQLMRRNFNHLCTPAFLRFSHKFPHSQYFQKNHLGGILVSLFEEPHVLHAQLKSTIFNITTLSHHSHCKTSFNTEVTDQDPFTYFLHFPYMKQNIGGSSGVTNK